MSRATARPRVWPTFWPGLPWLQRKLKKLFQRNYTTSKSVPAIQRCTVRNPLTSVNSHDSEKSVLEKSSVVVRSQTTEKAEVTWSRYSWRRYNSGPLICCRLLTGNYIFSDMLFSSTGFSTLNAEGSSLGTSNQGRGAGFCIRQCGRCLMLRGQGQRPRIDVLL